MMLKLLKILGVHVQSFTLYSKIKPLNSSSIKLAYFLIRNLKLFSEKNYKKQEQIFNHSLALLTEEIFCNLILRNQWTWTLKTSNCLTGLR